VREVRAARRVALYGVGREGLVMRALAMRLYHAGLRAFVVGDMAAEPVGPGNLLMVSARRAGTPSVLPMGSLYELSLWLLGDLLIEALKQAEGLDPQEMQTRHTNPE